MQNKEIILEALYDYKKWFEENESEIDKDKLTSIDSAINEIENHTVEPTLKINFTESDIHEMNDNLPPFLREDVFEWTIVNSNGVTHKVEISVGDDPESDIPFTMDEVDEMCPDCNGDGFVTLERDMTSGATQEYEVDCQNQWHSDNSI